MQPMVRKYRPHDKDAVCSLFSSSNMELIRPCFNKSVSSPLHLLIAAALCTAGYLLGSAPAAVALPVAFIALIYYSCHSVYSNYVHLQLRTDMKDISGSFLSRLDDCFWVAEALVNGKPQIVGAAAIKTKQSGEGRQAELCKLVVSSSCRRMGLGVKMVEVAIDFCKERGIPRMTLTTSNIRMAAVNLYKKVGFSVVSTYTEVDDRFWVAKLSKLQGMRMELRL